MPKKRINSSHYRLLKNKWLKKHKDFKNQVLTKHREAFEWIGEKVPAKEKMAGAAVGALMLANTIPAATAAASLPPESGKSATVQMPKLDMTDVVKKQLQAFLPSEVRPLTVQEEVVLGQVLTSDFGIPTAAELNGMRLNRSYGYIGAEQHLMRYPGDIMYSHLDNSIDNYDKLYVSGMAPGRGAWGYFARSKAELTDNAAQREKWYIAVPTFLAPKFGENIKGHYDWFKYRKMLVVNPRNGRSVIADIGDAGPAQWTGKHLGGSPEVMDYLQLHDGKGRGAVVYFFVDDEGDKIPLGPVVAGEINIK